MKKSPFFLYMSIFVSVFFLTACKETSVISMPLSVAIAPFNQPFYDGQLLAGYLPKEPGQISAGSMAQYDSLLKEKLADTGRNYIYLTQKDLDIDIQEDSKGRKNVLSTWAFLAQKAGAEFIVIPQVIDAQEKIEMGDRVTQPARLITDFFLVRATHPETGSDDGFLQARSHYREISHIKINMNEKGDDYVTTRQKSPLVDFVNEAIEKAISEFSL